MAGLAVEGEWVGLVHYGERNEALIEALRSRGARLEELQVYEWTMPENVEPLRVMVQEIVAGRIDAVAFTSQIQARHLFQVAEAMGLAPSLAGALNSRTVVASVGPTCTGALRSFGVTPRVEPERPKMRPMVTALVQYMKGGNSGG
jgi:uroporphyrinogen-III synthase